MKVKNLEGHHDLRTFGQPSVLLFMYKEESNKNEKETRVRLLMSSL